MTKQNNKYYILNPTLLQPLDIIMEKGEPRFSSVYQRKYGTPYTHSKLYMGNGEYIDVDGTIVKSHQVMRTLYQDKDEAVVLRYNENLTNVQKTNIEYFIRSQVGKEFHIPQKVNPLAKSDDVNEQNREYCVRLVATAYEAAGIKLVADPQYCAPKDFTNSQCLNDINIELSVASNKDIEYAKSESVLNNQDIITWGLLEKIRKITNTDIQTEEQFVHFLLNNPAMDGEIYNSIKGDPYFHMLDEYHENHPEEYDAQLLIDMFKENAINHAFAIYRLADIMQNGHWKINLQIYQYLQMRYRLKTFSLFVELYEKLREDCEKRKQLLSDVILRLGILNK